MRNIAVVAGTNVDTQMGVDYINEMSETDRRLYRPFAYPAFDTPMHCHTFQMQSNAGKLDYFEKLFKNAIKENNVEGFFVYCNSLSAAVDFEYLGKKLDVRVATPLMAYREIAQKTSKLAVIAANNQATAGIEAAFTEKNPECYVMGLGMLELVEAVEAKISPEEIIEKFNLVQLIDFFEKNGAEALVLGCTHFPYFEEELKKRCKLPIINPAEKMYYML